MLKRVCTRICKLHTIEMATCIFTPSTALQHGGSAKCRTTTRHISILPCTRRSGTSLSQTAFAAPSVAGAPSRSKGHLMRPQAHASGNEQGISAGPAVSSEVQANTTWRHVMVCVLDLNAFLSQHTQQALAVAASIAGRQKAGKVSVLVVEEEGTITKEPEKQSEAVRWHLDQHGIDDYKLIQKATSQPAVLMGDIADEVEAELLVISSQAVHAKFVDCNQLAEFVSCPILLLP